MAVSQPPTLCVAFMPTIGNGEDKVPKEDRTICEAYHLLVLIAMHQGRWLLHFFLYDNEQVYLLYCANFNFSWLRPENKKKEKEKIESIVRES